MDAAKVEHAAMVDRLQKKLKVSRESKDAAGGEADATSGAASAEATAAPSAASGLSTALGPAGEQHPLGSVKVRAERILAGGGKATKPPDAAPPGGTA